MSKQSVIPVDFPILIKEIKVSIQQAQACAIISANGELIRHYRDIARIIDRVQKVEGWSGLVIPRLSREFANELTEGNGFSERNIKRMLDFYREYPESSAIVPQPVAQLPGDKKVPQVAAHLPKYELTRALLMNLRSAIPTVDGIDARITETDEEERNSRFTRNAAKPIVKISSRKGMKP